MDIVIKILSYFPMSEAVPYFLSYYMASVFRKIKTKSSNDVSLIAWITSILIQYGYIVYGILIVREAPYIMSCITVSVGTTIVLVTALYYRFMYKKVMQRYHSKKISNLFYT